MDDAELHSAQADEAQAGGSAAALSRIKYASIFATPLLTQIWEDAPQLNPLLREHILAHEAKSQGVGVARSNDGGWHSDVGQLEFCGAAGQRLLEHARALANEGTRRVLADHGRKMALIEWTVYAWANINREGDFNKTHVHSASTWSGTYYIDTGDPRDPGGTPLQLMEPSQGRVMSFLPKLLPTSIYLRPKPGLMVLSVSYTHLTLPTTPYV